MRVLLTLLLVVGMVGSFNESEAAETLTLKGHTGSVRGVSFSPDGNRIVSGSVDKTLKVWDAQTGQETLTLKGHARVVVAGVKDAFIMCVSIGPDGNWIVGGCFDGSVMVWDATTGQSLADPIALPRHRTQIVCRQHGHTHRDPGVTLGERPDG